MYVKLTIRGNADRLMQAGQELVRCGVSKGKDIVKQSQALSWFVGGNRQKIVQLQKNLNKLGIKGKNGRLKEDGIYGKETLSAWMAFMKKLETGAVPTLAWVDVLKNNSTTLEIGSGFKGINNAMRDERCSLQEWRLIRWNWAWPLTKI